MLHTRIRSFHYALTRAHFSHTLVWLEAFMQPEYCHITWRLRPDPYLEQSAVINSRADLRAIAPPPYKVNVHDHNDWLVAGTMHG